jgi:polysaccharide biosynthesis transport protein
MTDNSNLPARRDEAAALQVPDQYSYGPDPAGDEGAGLASLRRVGSALLRFKWLVVGLLVLGTAVSVAGMRFVTFRYMAEATFWFDIQSRGDQMRGPIQSSGLLEDAAWTELMRSFRVLDHVVREERLYIDRRPADADLFRTFRLDSVFRPGEYVLVVDDTGRMVELRTQQGEPVDRVSRGEPLGRTLGFQWVPESSELPPNRKVPFEVLTPRDASRQLNRQLMTRMAGRGNFLSISYTHHDPQVAAAVINTLAARYVDIAAELKKFKISELREALETQLVTSQVNLAEAELRLESFRIQTITLPSDAASPVVPGIELTRAPVMAAFFTLKIEREDLQRDREALARIIDGSVGDSLSVDAISAVGAVQQSPELRQALADLTMKRAEVRALEQRYTPEHAILRKAIGEVQTMERVVVPQLAGRVVASLDTRAGVLDQLISSAGGELREIPPRAIEEARLRRSVAIAENMYNDLRQRYEAARLAEETSIPDVRVHDQATVPTRPVSDPRITLLLAGIFGSLALGVVMAVGLDRADPRLRYAEQVTGDMRLAIMGAVPKLRSARRGLLRPDENSRMLEALRSIRLNLLYAHGNAGPVMVTLTSPGPGDGKTFISANLALTFADLGMRTLVIDGDTRRGSLHHMYGVDRRPGLTDYLAGLVESGAVIRQTRFPLVHLIPGGTRRSDSPELLSSARLGELLAQIRDDYQAIIIDSPPLGAGIDPLILGTMTGNMLLVMRTGKTERALAEAKLEVLDRMPIRLLGVILNGMDQGSSYRYYSYMSGYEAGPEDPRDAVHRQVLQPG